MRKAKKNPKGPKLPSSLLNQIGATNQKRKKKTQKISRKEERKLQREDKKKKKQQFFTRNKVEKTEEKPKEEKTRETKKEKKELSYNDKLQQFAKINPKIYSMLEEQKLVPSFSSTQKENFDKDDEEIKQYEKKLGLNKKKKAPKDGLDDILDYKRVEGDEKDLEGNFDFLDEFENGGSENDLMDEDGNFTEENENEMNEGEEMDEVGEDESEEDLSEHEEMDDSDLDSENPDQEEDLNQFIEQNEYNTEEEEREKINKEIKKKERKSTDKQNDGRNQEVAKYVPPHLRGDHNDKNAKIKKAVKGLINRLSESNTESIFNEIENLYREHPRHDVMEIIVNCILDMCAAQTKMLESLLIVYCTFITLQYHIIGTEIGAFFVNTIYERFEKYYHSQKTTEELDEDSVNTKECINIISMLCFLYHMQMISSQLIKDYLSMFIQKLTEFDVELLVLIMKYCGFQIRQDDPITLKGMIQEIQTKSSTIKNQGSKMRFMLETLYNIKNNKKKENDSFEIKIQQIKKMIAGMIKKRSMQKTEPLNIGLVDLKSVDQKGRWWLVGSSWTGHGTALPKPDSNSSVNQLNESIGLEIINLAKSQGMNTDVRRSIFHVVITSQDYLEAFERLLKLGLKEKQQREIPRVILHCCGQEKKYNPYYGFLSLKFCEMEHSFKITFQYCIWDFFKQIEDSSTQKLKNMAKFLAFMFQKEAVGLIILKVVEFHKLSERYSSFLVLVLATLLLETDEESLVSIFRKISKQDDVREGLNFFFQLYVLPSEIEEDKKAKIKSRFKLVKNSMFTVV